MKLFGKELFNFKSEPTTMWDFAQFGLVRNGQPLALTEWTATAITTVTTATTGDTSVQKKVKKEKRGIGI